MHWPEKVGLSHPWNSCIFWLLMNLLLFNAPHPHPHRCLTLSIVPRTWSLVWPSARLTHTWRPVVGGRDAEGIAKKWGWGWRTAWRMGPALRPRLRLIKIHFFNILVPRPLGGGRRSLQPRGWGGGPLRHPCRRRAEGGRPLLPPDDYHPAC